MFASTQTSRSPACNIDGPLSSIGDGTRTDGGSPLSRACESSHSRTTDSTASIASSCFQPSSSSGRSEEHTSELQSLMRISYAVFCLKKKTTNNDETK